MVKKNTQSKRLTLKKKYKIAKKVREHHRKINKIDKKKAKSGRRPKMENIPNSWPFKEQVLQEVKDYKTSKKADEQQQRDAAKRAKESKQAALSQQQQLRMLTMSAARRGHAFETAASGASAGGGMDLDAKDAAGVTDSSKRAYFRELRKILELSDVLVEVLDARDPMGCRCQEVERMFLQQGPQRRIILVLNKVDLVPKEVTQAWLQRLRQHFPTIAFKASTQSQKHTLGHVRGKAEAASESALSSGECLGGEALLQLLKNYSRSQNMKTAITAGVIGFPNVGKSSLINSLRRERVAEVGAQPGITKVAQEIVLDKKVKLLDCPGIVFSKDASDPAVILRNCVRIDSLDDVISPAAEIVRRVKPQQLMLLYNVPLFSNVTELLESIARRRGKLHKGGAPDVETAARMLLGDWNAGKIGYYTLPPAEASTGTSAVVAGWAKEFDLDAVAQDELVQATHALRSCALTLTLLQVLHRMDERPDDDFTALEFTGSLEAYVGTLDAAAAAVRAGGAAAMAMDEDVDNGVEAGATPATSKGQKKKAAAAKSKPVAALGIQKGAAAAAKAAAPRPNAFAALQGDDVSTAASLDAAAKAAPKVTKAKARKVAPFPTKAVDPAFADLTFKELKPLDALSFLPKKN